MKTTRVTHIFVLTVTTLVSAYTLAMAFNDVTGDTVSEVMDLWWSRWWALPLAWGALAGHWRGPDPPATWWNNGLVLALLGVVGLGLGSWHVPSPLGWLGWFGDLGLMVIGYGLGAVLWPLERRTGEVRDVEVE